jgi:hypothetical protein
MEKLNCIQRDGAVNAWQPESAIDPNRPSKWTSTVSNLATSLFSSEERGTAASWLNAKNCIIPAASRFLG